MPTAAIRLCEPSTTLCEAWRELYQGAFPANEREPEEKLRMLLDSNKLLLHKTLDEEGSLLCFTMVSLADDFSFLAYMATNPAKRSGGIGTKHLTRLIEILKEGYPTHIGLYLEIEATEPKTLTLTPAEDLERKRRLSFYINKCGAERVCRDSLYLTPSKSEPGKEWEGELLYVDFGHVKPDNRTLLRVIREIHVRFYMLSPCDPLVNKVVDSFKACYPDAVDGQSSAEEVCTVCGVAGHDTAHKTDAQVDTQVSPRERNDSGPSGWRRLLARFRLWFARLVRFIRD